MVCLDKLLARQYPANQSSHVTDTEVIVIVHIGTNHADIPTAQDGTDEQRHVSNSHATIVVHVTLFVTVLGTSFQGYLLGVAPSALGAIAVEGLHLVEISSLGNQVLYH